MCLVGSLTVFVINLLAIAYRGTFESFKNIQSFENITTRTRKNITMAAKGNDKNIVLIAIKINNKELEAYGVQSESMNISVILYFYTFAYFLPGILMDRQKMVIIR